MYVKSHTLVPTNIISSKSLKTTTNDVIRHSFSTSTSQILQSNKNHNKKRLMVVEAKGKKGMQERQFQRKMPALPKIEDDGNPRFVIFIRMANVS